MQAELHRNANPPPIVTENWSVFELKENVNGSRRYMIVERHQVKRNRNSQVIKFLVRDSVLQQLEVASMVDSASGQITRDSQT
mmetsp:Transcript_93554/g.166441  ORF Transcript_93554/g.166441 Transcript_93554/m.166441 type:complete len:83 (-) Transcript_93554:566-814(-)